MSSVRQTSSSAAAGAGFAGEYRRRVSSTLAHQRSTGAPGGRDGYPLFRGELHSPADHFGGMQPDDRPGRLTVRPRRTCESLRPAADQHAPGPPWWQHVIDHQGDVRVALRVVELPGPGEIPAADVDRVLLGVVAPAQGNDV